MPQMSREQIAALNEFGESDAWVNYYRHAPPEFIRKYRLAAHRVGSVTVTMIPELDWTFFNRVVGLGVREPATEAMLDDAIGILDGAGCKNYMAQVCPAAQPAQLSEWLAARGFVPGRNWVKMYRGNQPAPSISTDLRLVAIGDDLANAFGEVAVTAFGMPPDLGPLIAALVGKPGWHHYLAFDGAQPVAAAAMFVAGDVCWLGFGCTLEKHRGRGSQGAMFARRIQDGLELGCKWFVTETGEETPDSPNSSFHNMQRAGFELAYLRRNFIHQP